AVEFGFFDNRLTGEVGYYNNQSKGLILKSSISPSTGYARQNRNVGVVSNKGLEIVLGGDIIRNKNFNWHSSFNISFNNNVLEDLKGGTLFDFGNPGSVVEGEALGNIHGYVVEGFFDSQQEIDDLNASAPDGTYQSPTSMQVGNYKYKDLNGDGQITAEDQKSLG